MKASIWTGALYVTMRHYFFPQPLNAEDEGVTSNNENELFVVVCCLNQTYSKTVSDNLKKCLKVDLDMR